MKKYIIEYTRLNGTKSSILINASSKENARLLGAGHIIGNITDVKEVGQLVGEMSEEDCWDGDEFQLGD